MRVIDADSLKETLHKWHINNRSEVITGDEACEAFYYMIDDEDTADVVPVIHAHWILDPNGMDFGLSAWKCSNCGRQNTMIPSFIPTKCGGYVPKNPNVFAGSNYCPNCGAKMDEETKYETNH